MKRSHIYTHLKIYCFAFIMFLTSRNTIVAQEQNIRFGVFAEPLISWFASDNRLTQNDGSRPGLNFGFTFNRYFSKNYSFSSGLSLMHAGGRLTASDTVVMHFTNFNSEVLPGESMSYRIQYLNIPLGLKFESNQIGYMTFFADLGLDAKVIVGGKVDLPSLDIEKEAAGDEIRTFNLGYHIMGGIQYSLGGTTEMVFGMGFEHNFLDVTADIDNQAVDVIKHNILRFRIGINF